MPDTRSTHRKIFDGCFCHDSGAGEISVSASAAVWKCRVEAVIIFGVEVIAHHAERLAETLEVDNLALPQKPNGSNDIGIIHKAQNVVIGRASLLLGSHILGQIRNGIALGCKRHGTEGRPACGLRIDTCREVDKVSVKALSLDLLRRQIPRQLMHNRPDHLQMCQFFRTY